MEGPKEYETKCRIFSEDEIKQITDGYRWLLGGGSFGKVYKGTLEDGQLVAVKISHLLADSKAQVDVIDEKQRIQFVTELEILSRLQHDNVVGLVGFCRETKIPILVYEYISGGNLDELLHPKGHQHAISLEQRLNIAIKIAKALAYVHSLPKGPIVHCDLKPENILMGDDLEPKVADFGLSKILAGAEKEYASYVRGTQAYMDVTHMMTARLSPKCDVYSFGIILLEIITRRNVIDDQYNHLMQAFAFAYRSKRLSELIDKDIVGEASTKFIGRFGRLVEDCTSIDMKVRPEMTKVVDILQKLMDGLHIAEEGEDVTQVVKKVREAREFTSYEIEKVTNNYSTELFSDEDVDIYKGILNDGQHVSVAALKFIIYHYEKVGFEKQVVVLSQYQHPNFVNVVGFCKERTYLIVVMEYSNYYKSLEEILYSRSPRVSLSLYTRLHFAIQLAEALVFNWLAFAKEVCLMLLTTMEVWVNYYHGY